jgi:hypothetical protein
VNAATLTVATPADITRTILFDDIVRPDGYTNRQRAAFVLATFGCETLDFDDVFDFESAYALDDANLVAAHLNLAILQAFYVELLYYYQYLSDGEWEELRTYFVETTQRLGGHLQLLLAGIPPQNVVFLH